MFFSVIVIRGDLPSRLGEQSPGQAEQTGVGKAGTQTVTGCAL